MNGAHPVTFSIDYPDRDLERLTTGFRMSRTRTWEARMDRLEAHLHRRGQQDE